MSYNTGLALEHDIGIEILFSSFDRNFKDFRNKHELGDQMAYMVNSDGKFRCEIKETAESEDYIIRISGWKNDDELLIQRLYVSDPLKLYDYVLDFLDLLEVWALDHKGNFYFKYVDFDEPALDAYNVVMGHIKYIPFSDADLQEVLEIYGR